MNLSLSREFMHSALKFPCIDKKHILNEKRKEEAEWKTLRTAVYVKVFHPLRKFIRLCFRFFLVLMSGCSCANLQLLSSASIENWLNKTLNLVLLLLVPVFQALCQGHRYYNLNISSGRIISFLLHYMYIFLPFNIF